MTNEDSLPWAEAEFGHTELGDARRTERLVAMTAQAATTPAGKVTEVFREAASREAAYRFLENDDVSLAEIGRAAGRACAHRCVGRPLVFVPIDQSSLNLTDDQDAKNLGVVGTRSVGAKGLCVMSAIAVEQGGTPLGICGQAYWARKERSKGHQKRDRRAVGDKETGYWLDVMDKTRCRFAEEAPEVVPWFQLDRGGDAWPILLEAATTMQTQIVTVRATHNRRLWDEDGAKRYLFDELSRREMAGWYELDVPGSPTRTARRATMVIRYAPVTLELRDLRTGRRYGAAMWAVSVREEGTTPDGEAPIEWVLATSYPVETLADAQLVLEGYAARWRIEEFHKVWKTGACRVEDSLLGDFDHIVRWATLLASVAMRILRLMYLGRRYPELPATVELTPSEIRAVVLMKKGKATCRRGQIPKMGDVVRWIADLGGYTGKSSGGPPGAIVIARGLQRIEPLAEVLDGGIEM